MKISLLAVLGGMILLSSCAVFKKSTTSVSEFDNYQEDLSESRIKFPDLEEQRAKEEALPVNQKEVDTVDEQLALALQRVRQTNESEMYWSGYTVLVYSGLDRELAFETRNELFKDFPDFKTDIQYQQPRYLIKVGQFANRIEALSFYHQLKPQFPDARIIQDRFVREGYVLPEPSPADGNL